MNQGLELRLESLRVLLAINLGYLENKSVARFAISISAHDYNIRCRIVEVKFAG